MIFSKPSTRTRVSAETAWNFFGGSCLFLGKNDGQWASEPLRDTATVISSMTSAIMVRWGKHAELEEISKYSAVPVINALTDLYHPLDFGRFSYYTGDVGKLDGVLSGMDRRCK
jgi:ornithine carbamoyltransferase